MKKPQDKPQEANGLNLADLYADTVADYFCGAEAKEQMREGAELMGEILHELGRMATGTLPALMRAATHYAATSVDHDKTSILATLTAPNGAVAMLARLTSDADRLNVWGDILETIAAR